MSGIAARTNAVRYSATSSAATRYSILTITRVLADCPRSTTSTSSHPLTSRPGRLGLKSPLIRCPRTSSSSIRACQGSTNSAFHVVEEPARTTKTGQSLLGRRIRSLLDYFRKLSRMRNKCCVATFDLSYLAACPFRHESLQLRIDRTVGRGNDCPTRLCLPRRLSHSRVHQFSCGHDLRTCHESGVVRWQIGGEVCTKQSWVEIQKTIWSGL